LVLKRGIKLGHFSHFSDSFSRGVFKGKSRFRWGSPGCPRRETCIEAGVRVVLVGERLRVIV